MESAVKKRIAEILYFMQDGTSQTPTSVSKALGIDRDAVHRYLERLAGEGELTYEEVGAYQVYRIRKQSNG